MREPIRFLSFPCRLVLAACLALAALPALAAAGSAAPDWLAVSRSLGSTPDFTLHGTQPGLAYPLETPDGCMGCHGPSGGPEDPSFSFRPHPAWAGSMMANGMRDPLFLAALDIANADVPGVGDFCLRCHTSNAWYNGRVVKQGYGLPDNDVTLGSAACLLEGAYDAPDSYSDYSGTTCHFCHRLMPEGPHGEPLPGNGAAWLDDTDCGGWGEPCRRGPYSYTGYSPPHPWKFSPLHKESALCGQCHDASSPDLGSGPARTLILNDGTDTGIAFPLERTYSEWQRSAFADGGGEATCQGCHMPISEDPAATACANLGAPNRTGNLAVHAWAGASTWILSAINGEYSDTSDVPGSWEGIGRQDSFAQTINWTREMLQSAATIDAEVTDFSAPGTGSAGALEVRVRVINQSGHKLPTGHMDGRRVWLNVRVHDRHGNLVAESAAYDADSAVLTEDPQARVYEIHPGIWNGSTGECVIHDSQGRLAFHQALGNCIAKDSRIPPLGFKPGTSSDPHGYDVRPVGFPYPETAPGSGILVNYDQADYQFSLPAGTEGPFSVQARLYYQTASRAYIEFLRNRAQEIGILGENQMCSAGPGRPYVTGPQDRTRGEYLYQLWANAPDDPQQPGYGKSPPELMAVASAGTDRIFQDGFDAAQASPGF